MSAPCTPPLCVASQVKASGALQGELCDATAWNNPARKFANVLPGGLVGGPDLNDAWKDDHTNYVQSEVALDYNAGLVSGALCLLPVVPAGQTWLDIINVCTGKPFRTPDTLDVAAR